MFARTLLFAPANRPDLYRKFPQLKADVFTLDLEDGTPPAERPVARANLKDSVRAARGDRDANLYVRINPVGSPDFVADLDAVNKSGATGIVLAKAGHVREIESLRTDLPVIAGIESIEGVVNAPAIAAGPSVVAVYFGAEDFAAEMGARRTPVGLEVLYARSQVVLAAKAARVKAFDQVVLDLKNDELFRQDATFGRNLGYDGKMCIHPRQVDLANEVFAPTPSEIDYASRLVVAFEAAQARGEATINFEGRMVDGPVVKAALSVLAAAAQER
jgi:citrate lyase subunit beta / citryl-CoA lyase